MLRICSRPIHPTPTTANRLRARPEPGESGREWAPFFLKPGTLNINSLTLGWSCGRNCESADAGSEKVEKAKECVSIQGLHLCARPF